MQNRIKFKAQHCTRSEAPMLVLLLLLVVGSTQNLVAQTVTSDSPEDKAAAAYGELQDAYLHSEWEQFTKLQKTILRHQRFFTPEQRKAVKHARRTAKSFQPKWWSRCSSPSKTQFPAKIWNTKILANYVPSSTLGVQAVQPKGRYRRTRNGYEYVITSLAISVSWKPSMINSPVPATGKLAELHDTRLADLGEVIVWHELGHNYVTAKLPLNDVVELYKNHQLLYSHLQEFYADLTSLYHASPRARRLGMLIRLQALDYYDEEEPHTRGAHGIGAMFLTHVLTKPDQWLSIHFPPQLPEQQIELNTLIYVYEHWDPQWSIIEAKNLRELVDTFINKEGDRTLRRKGVAKLPNKLSFSLMVAQDRAHQIKRDQWVKEKLTQIIADGRADSLSEGETYNPAMRRKRDHNDMLDTNDSEKLRIDLPF